MKQVGDTIWKTFRFDIAYAVKHHTPYTFGLVGKK